MAIRSDALKRVIQKAGTSAALARIAGVWPTAVSQWNDVPLRHVPKVAEALGMQLSDVRPDVFKPEAA